MQVTDLSATLVAGWVLMPTVRAPEGSADGA